MKTMKSVVFAIVLGLTVTACSAANEDNDAADANYAPAASASSNSKAKADSSSAEKPASRQSATPYEGMTFEDYGTHPFVTTEEDHLSTFAMDVDTGSYTMARSFIQKGDLPPQEAVRLEEFINYFDLSYAPPKKDTFAIHVDAGPAPLGNEELKLVRIGIKGKEIESDERKRANLTFVIDVSGSMDRDNRIGLVKRSLKMLVNQLEPTDRIGIVVYGSTARTVLKPTSVEDEDAILDAIDGLQIEGATNAEAGLLEGYQMASKLFEKDAINRVILCSDGVANVGKTGPEDILDTVQDYAGQSIYLSTFGFGMDNYNDVLMEQLADKGNGTYAYIDDIDESRKVFREQLTSTLQTIAKDAKIQVDFDPDQVSQYRLLGYENRAIADEDFRNNRVDGGEIGAGHTVTALYEVQLKKSAGDKPLGTVTIRYKDVDEKNRSKEISETIHLSRDLSDETEFIASVAEFAEIMKSREGNETERLQDVLKLARRTASTERQDEFTDLVESAIEISEQM